MQSYQHYLFDWGDTLMVDDPNEDGPMADWPRVQAMPGALETLQYLSLNAQCHLATNAKDSDPEMIEAALARVGLDQYIERVFCFRSLHVDKRWPDFFFKVVAELRCAPTEVVMVGDSLESDVHSAMSAGVQAIWFNRWGMRVPKGVVSIRRLDELLVEKKRAADDPDVPQI